MFEAAAQLRERVKPQSLMTVPGRDILTNLNSVTFKRESCFGFIARRFNDK
jgi:hypothetical protein